MSGKGLVVALVSVESVGQTFQLESDQISAVPATPQADDVITAYMANDFVDTPVYQREKITAGQRVSGPALVIEATGTNVI